ncbi:MAG: T9SS type A sorting domain-containing protein [Chitinophagales bacterium]|nr:T9SS type A sorting domain-containing protein [Chitinophagales bacterium]
MLGALNETGTTLIDFEHYSQDNNPDGGVYILRDFCKSGDAIRIKLPYIDYVGGSNTAPGAIKNQYLWLENHQMISEFDHENNEGAFNSTPWASGMYAYIQVGKDRKLTTDPGHSTDIFQDVYDYYDPNCLGSWMMPIQAEGNFDFDYRPNLEQLGACWQNSSTYVVPFDKSSYNTLPNPFTGCSDLFNYYDRTGDGRILLGSPYADSSDVYRGEVVNGAFSCNMQGYGDSEDAFSLASGKSKIGISTNPSPVTVLTLQSHEFNVANDINPPTSSTSPYFFDQYENRTIHLNGLSIEILNEIPNTTWGATNMMGETPVDLKVRIRWDDYDIINDARWCAPDIQLHPSVHFDPANLPLNDPTEYSVNITGGHSVTLDRGASPTQHIAYDNDPVSGQYRFAQPTVMTCLPNSYFHIDPYGSLYIKNGSTLTMQAGSKLEVHEGAAVYVQKGSTLILEDGAMLYIWNDGLVDIEPGGKIIIKNNVAGQGIQLNYPQYNQYTAELRVEGTLKFDNGADFIYQGTGFYHFMNNSNLTLSNNSDIIWDGAGQGHKMIELDDNVVLTLDGHPVTIKNGDVSIHNNAKIKVLNASIDVNHVNFTGFSSAPIGNEGLYGKTISTVCDIKNSTFTNFATGLELRQIALPLQVNINTCSFSNCPAAINCNQVDKMRIIDCTPTYNLAAGSKAISLINCKNTTMDGGEIQGYDQGFNLTDVKALYMDGSSVYNCNTGIYGVDSKIWMRNGAKVDQTLVTGMALYGSWNSGSGAYTSMLTMGDAGCAMVVRDGGAGIKGTNTILNIDPVTNDINSDNNGLFNPLWFTRNTGNSALLFDMCYTQASNPITTIKARRNIWCPPGGVNVPPAPSSYKFQNSATCSSSGGVTFDRQPISVCVPSTYDCSFCNGQARIADSGEEDSSLSVSDIVTDAFSDAYDDFIIKDNDNTRENFSTLSVLGLNYDSLNTSWTLTTVDGIELPTVDSIVNLIMVAKILDEEIDSSAERLSGENVEDIFAKYYTQMQSGSKSKPSMLFVYPNPAQKQVTIELRGTSEIRKVILLDLLGRSFYHGTIDSKVSVDVSMFPKGFYLLKGLKADGSVAELQQFIVQ